MTVGIKEKSRGDYNGKRKQTKEISIDETPWDSANKLRGPAESDMLLFIL
ncbi:hypothetical protein [Clostridium estertheticum]|nr:hypothetical protein [Clostridium estertheticum]WLC78908.1 hypothetical protein KTC98_17185 [Clostridium estertheticum]